MPKSSGALLLDLYPSAAVAYSLRKLRTAYSGNAIRVRRSSDNTEQDIGFVGNELDTTTMLDFVGYNLLTYSEDITQQLVGGGRATYTNNVEISPDSNITGGKFAADGTFGEHYWFRNAVTILNSTSYNISVYLKQADFTKVRVSSNISGSAQNCDVDLTNGNVTNNGFANTPVVTAEANGWYRFSVTITSGTTSASPISIRLYNTSGAISFFGDAGKGVYVWGTQLSQTSTVKTYQKTVATAVGNGFVTTWYDQSGNANNATQATAANQCQIVSSGALILDVNTNKITSTWTTDFYNLTNGISINTKYLSVSMWRRQATATNRLIHLGNNIVNFKTPLIWTGSTSSYNVQSYMDTLVNHQQISTQGRCIMTSLKDSSNLKVAYRNGTQLTTTATEAPSVGTLDLFGQTSTIATSGQYQEYIYWGSEQSANRTGIETDINTYWNAY
jgi:hypothetical protein